MPSQHPRGLYVCFATELWERFSYYGMRALLIFYLMQHFLFSEGESYLIYGTYTALVYMTPVLGGAIADRYLGARKAVTLGAILLVIGHLGIAVEGPPATQIGTAAGAVARDAVSLQIFYTSLAFIIVGVGFLKTNASTLVGALYGPNDPRRDSGFTIFYMGINLGGAAAPLLCGWIGQTYGWRYGFGLAGIGMLAGLFTFLRGQRHLHGLADPPNPAWLREPVIAGLSRELLIYASSVALVIAAWLLLNNRQVVGPMLTVFGIVTGLGVLYYSLSRCNPVERDRLLVCAALIVFTIGFWALYEQMGSSLAVFADRLVDRTIFGFTVPASMFQSLPPIFILLLAPVASALWLHLGRRGREPSATLKFSLALLQVGLAFLVLTLGLNGTEPGAKVALGWFVLNFFLMTCGELCLAPVGMSVVTKLAPRRIVGVMMGAFFLAYSASSYISGLVAQLTSQNDAGVSPIQAFANVYTRLGVIALALALVLFLLAPVLTRRSHENHAHRMIAPGHRSNGATHEAIGAGHPAEYPGLRSAGEHSDRPRDSD
ncbi:peptide MFS transporter [Steroidobacter sp.]|uniref:peptide MFS transporter n=1 Tax=Steroidobacter sp. TaxID=1978227 RepID=UPI001A5E8D4D|nr:peptide MFS transporter [Steroidobacter sp.]MBL8269273.1 peptide MFS transporter [Steroidobacter sp.]